MHIQQKSLIKACDKLGIKYKIVDLEQVCIQMFTNPITFAIHHQNPFINSSTSRLLKDKDLTHKLFQNLVKMSRFKSYIDPSVNEKYRGYIKYKSISEIIADVKNNFSYPFIVKKNRGSIGKNVFKVKDDIELEKAINAIFNQSSLDYDYLAIVEDLIDVKNEYRVITLSGKVEILYLKDNSNAKYIGNLSPLHFEGAKAVDIEDQDLNEKIEEFLKPVFTQIDLSLGGFDIAENEYGDFVLIEINGAPSLEIYARDNGISKVDELYLKLLKHYID